MTGTFAGRPRAAPRAAPPPVRFAGIFAAVAAALLAGCAGGLLGPLPEVTQPDLAGTVTVYRDTWEGFIGPIVLRIDGRRAFRLWVNQEFSFKLDPGEYVFYYTIGVNECSRVAFIQSRGRYKLRLAPNCARFLDAY